MVLDKTEENLLKNKTMHINLSRVFKKSVQSNKKACLIHMRDLIYVSLLIYLVDFQSEVALQMKKLVDLDPSMARPFLTHAPAYDHVIKAGLLTSS